MAIPAQLDPLFDAAGEAHNVDPNLLRALALQESGGNPNAPRGSSGEIGMMQFMPATASRFGIDPSDPAQAIDGAARYLREGLDQGGQLRGQNPGLDPVVYAVRRYNGDPGSDATARYASSVATHYAGLSQLAAADGGGAGGGSDQLLDDYFNNKVLPYQAPAAGAPTPGSLSGAGPGSGPGAAVAAAATPGGAAPGGGTPALDVGGLIETYNRYRTFPAGIPMAAQALGMLQKFAPEGYQLNTDGSLQLRPGYAGGAAQLEGAKAAATEEQKRITAAVAPATLASGATRVVPPLPGSAPGTQPTTTYGQPSEDVSKALTEMRGKYDAAVEGLPQAMQLQQTLQRLGTAGTGPGADWKAQLSAILESSGFSKEQIAASGLPDASSAYEAQKLSTGLVLRQLKDSVQRITNRDITIMQKATPGTEMPLGASQEILGKFVIPQFWRTARMYEDIAGDRGATRDSSAFNAAYANWARQNPLSNFYVLPQGGGTAPGAAAPGAAGAGAAPGVAAPRRWIYDPATGTSRLAQ